LDLGARRGHDQERGECGGRSGDIGFATVTAAGLYVLFLLLSVVVLVVILGSGT